MKNINFTIKGNHNGPDGNPMPKVKLTGRQSFTKKAQDYVRWKHHVVNSFLEQSDPNEKEMYLKNIFNYKHPIVLGKYEHASMFLRIKWGNNSHGDPENCFGSIADALFYNDKNVDIRTVSSMSEEKSASVRVIIHIFETEAEKLELINQ